MRRISTATRSLNKFGAGKDGFTDGDVVGGIPSTDLEAVLFDHLQEEPANLVEGAGITLDGNVRTQLAQAVRRVAGANVTVVTTAMSPFSLSADHAGLVLVNAAAGNVVLNLPLANLVASLPLSYDFERVDVTASTATVNSAGANLIDGVTSFTLAGQWTSRSIRGDAVSAWATLAQSAVAIQQPGEICMFAKNTAPVGFLKANGAAVSRTVYAALFTAISTTFGVGDGSTTFNLPDLRGEFIRCWDDARGVDAGRAIGTAQADAMQTHTHTFSALVDQSTGGSGTTSPSVNSANFAGTTAGPSGRVATETRPRNIALLACIKF